MEGILLINKPKGITSHKVIEIIRKKTKIKKVGHAGTLDPLATGLLVVMIGKKYTKLSNQLICKDKIYLVTMQLSILTNTGDFQGEIIKKTDIIKFKRKEIEQVFNIYQNYSYFQKPPLFSAIKVKGKKLYEYARKKIEVIITPRIITIYSIKLLNYNSKKGIIKFETKCSKGTYIRSLVKDIAEQLKTIATVKQLKRIQSGNFNIKQAYNLNNLSSKKIEQILIKKIN